MRTTIHWGWLLAGVGAAFFFFGATPQPPPGPTGPVRATLAPGSMGMINSGGQSVTLVLPPGAAWVAQSRGMSPDWTSMSGSLPLVLIPYAGIFSFEWMDANGLEQITTVLIQ